MPILPERPALLGRAAPGAGAIFGAGSYISVIGFGDSIIAGEAASDAPHQWLNIVAAAFGAGSPLNKGIPGTVLQDSNGSNGAPFSSNGRDRFAADTLAANKRDLMCLAYGFNDARCTDAPATFNVTQYGIQLRQVLSGLITGGYGIDHIVLVGPYYITDTGLASGSAGFAGQTRAGFEAHVAEAAAAAAEYGVFYADAYAFMRDNGGAALITTGDNIHPVDAGHAAIAACVLGCHRANLRSAPSVAAFSFGGGVLNAAVTPPASGPISSYTFEYATAGSFAFTGTIISPSLTASWSGLGDGSYRVRARADFVDGTHSPWAFAPADVSVSPFLYDSFTDAAGTAITAHTGETGASWTVQSGNSPATPDKIDGGGALYANAANGIYQSAGSPPSADYYVEAVLTKLSTVTNDKVGVIGRADPAANSWYMARWNEAGSNWQLYRTVAGVSTQMNGSIAGSFNVGDSHVLRLTMNGSTISMSLDGAQIQSKADTVITAAGHAGVYFGTAQSATSGVHIDKIIGGT